MQIRIWALHDELCKKAVTVAHNPKFVSPTFENVQNASLKKGLTKAEFENLTKAEKKAFREAFEKEKAALVDQMVADKTVRNKILEKAKDKDHLLTAAQLDTIEREIAAKKVEMHYGQSKKTKEELKETMEKRIKDAHKTNIEELKPLYNNLNKKSTEVVTLEDQTKIMDWLTKTGFNFNPEVFKEGVTTQADLRRYLRDHIIKPD
jgi:hypothetical protein